MSLDNVISIIKEEFLDKILDHTKYAEENILHIKVLPYHPCEQPQFY